MKQILVFLVFASALIAQVSRTATLTWTDTQNPTTGTTYNVYRGTGACSANPTLAVLQAGVSVKTFADTTVATGVTYCYAVTAVVGGIESAKSGEAGAVVGPFAPTLLTVGVQ